MQSSSRGAESNQAQVADSAQSRRRLDAAGPVEEHPASTLMIGIDGIDSVDSKKRRQKVVDQVSWVITDAMRSTDAVYLHGEAGFCVVMAETSEDEAMAAADRLRANVESMPLLADAGVTVTVGVAVGSEADLAASIARAERAVSSAQAANRVIWADDTPPD
jgi:diguanylate cyclase (GGDEF)-like protein